MAASKKAAKKTTAKKKAAKKSSSTNTTKRTAPKKSGAKKTAQPQATEAAVKDCMCKQKKSGGNFFCFRLIEGKWIQASDIGFPSKEVCEAATCGD